MRSNAQSPTVRVQDMHGRDVGKAGHAIGGLAAGYYTVTVTDARG